MQGDVLNDDFREAIMGDDDLSAIIRTQIHVEMQLYELIDALLVNPDFLSKASLEYNQICVLAISLGLHERFYRPLKFLGTIRNKFAHDLTAKISKLEMDNFYECFSTEDKAIIQKSFNKIKGDLNDGKEKVLNLRSPRDRFACYAITLRAALIAAVNQTETSFE